MCIRTPCLCVFVFLLFPIERFGGIHAVRGNSLSDKALLPEKPPRLQSQTRWFPVNLAMSIQCGLNGTAFEPFSRTIQAGNDQTRVSLRGYPAGDTHGFQTTLLLQRFTSIRVSGLPPTTCGICRLREYPPAAGSGYRPRRDPHGSLTGHLRVSLTIRRVGVG
jgi:hypothetical protein